MPMHWIYAIADSDGYKPTYASYKPHSDRIDRTKCYKGDDHTYRFGS